MIIIIVIYQTREYKAYSLYKTVKVVFSFIVETIKVFSKFNTVEMLILSSGKMTLFVCTYLRCSAFMKKDSAANKGKDKLALPIMSSKLS